MTEIPSNPKNRQTGYRLFTDSGWWDALVKALYEASQSARWGTPTEQFGRALQRSVRKRFGDEQPRRAQAEEYARSLHLEDLGLACACAEGCEAAWQEFVGTYRHYLRASAAAILRCSPQAPEAAELADSLFAELYGLGDLARGETSLFRYFHGRSSLKTWLRAVLAQRHVDALRSTRRLEPLDEGEDGHIARFGNKSEQSGDPHRTRYVALFSMALEAALAKLPERDRWRLRAYYAEQLTLAEIGKRLDEHESSVSRNLEHIRMELREGVANLLRSGEPSDGGPPARRGLSEEEIALCIEYASEDVSIDLEKLLPAESRQKPAAARRRE